MTRPYYGALERDEHVCTFDHDTATSPDHAGRVTVTEWCACGRAIRTYLDHVL